MRKPVSRVARSYGAAQLAQYLVARLCADNAVETMDDIKQFVELVAQQTIDDLDQWISLDQSENVETIVEPKTARKELF